MPWSYGTLPDKDPETEPILGPGDSRPLDGQRVRFYSLLIKMPGASPLRWHTPAPTAKDAIRYAKNRWRNCTATIIS
jgi:hypothetical protein